MSKSLKFIFFPLGCVLAHVGRMTLIAKALRARGHEVVFGGEDPDQDPRSKLGLPKEAGFRWVYAREADYRYAWNRFEKYGWLATAWDILYHDHWAPLDVILEGHIQLIKREKPDMVVGDGTISVSTAAHICGIPASGVMNAYNLNFLTEPSVYAAMIPIYDRFHLAPIRRPVYAKYGVKQVSALHLLQNILLLSPDLPQLFPKPSGWPNWHTVGPIVFEPSSPRPYWIEELDDGVPNIYLTMGSTGLLKGLLGRTFEALGRAEYRFLITTGGQVDDDLLALAPPNFRFAKFASGSQLLKKSQALVFHGGNGTMYQGLAAGRPMIALPSHLEQEMNFRAALTMGFGLRLSSRRVTGIQILNALQRVLDEPHFIRSSQALSGAVRNSDGASEAAELLEQWAKAGVPAGYGLA